MHDGIDEKRSVATNLDSPVLLLRRSLASGPKEVCRRRLRASCNLNLFESGNQVGATINAKICEGSGVIPEADDILLIFCQTRNEGVLRSRKHREWWARIE